jgi:3-deoxy-D-manno-octulosonic-acid transferase
MPVAYLLNIVYLLLIALASPWLVYSAIRKGKYRAGFAQKFLGRVPQQTSDRPCVWLHAVSVGEVNLLATLLAELDRRRPDVECVISTTTVTGFALAKQKYASRTVFYAPLDFTWAVRAAMRRIRPDVLVLAELELWPNLITAAKAHGAKVAIVNGRLSEKSFRGYRKIAGLVRRVLAHVDLIAAQNEEYADRFRAFKSDVRVTGSLKFDGATTDRHNAKTRELAQLAGIAPSDVVFLAGSTQEPEEQLAINAFAELSSTHPELRLMIVPRHKERFDAVAEVLDRSGLPWARRSLLGTGNRRLPTPRILLVDTIGELGAWWGTAHIAFVGGSMGSRGGQNMVEPAAYGAAVSFGENTWNFRDIVLQLLAAEAAVVVPDGRMLAAFVRRCVEDPQFRDALGAKAQRLVQSQFGATRKTVDLLCALLPRAATSRQAA